MLIDISQKEAQDTIHRPYETHDDGVLHQGVDATVLLRMEKKIIPGCIGRKEWEGKSGYCSGMGGGDWGEIQKVRKLKEE